MTKGEIGLAQEVYQLISQAFIHLDAGERQLMKQFGLTVTQYWALVHLEDIQGRSLSELARLLLCDKSNITGVVDKLEEMGLAERKRGKAGDRRYTCVVLTPQGRQLRNTSISAREHMVKMRLSILKDQELQQLRTSLQQLNEILQAQFEKDEVKTIIENSIEHSYSVAPDHKAPTGSDAQLTY